MSLFFAQQFNTFTSLQKRAHTNWRFRRSKEQRPRAPETPEVPEVIIHPPVADFLQCTCAKNYENWLTVYKVIAKIARLNFLAHPVHYIIYIAYFFG